SLTLRASMRSAQETREQFADKEQAEEPDEGEEHPDDDAIGERDRLGLRFGGFRLGGLHRRLGIELAGRVHATSMPRGDPEFRWRMSRRMCRKRQSRVRIRRGRAMI